MKKSTIYFITNILIILISIWQINIINHLSKNRIIEYSTMLASKFTKYVINSAYIQEDFDITKEKIYEMIQDNDGDIKTIIYDATAVNNLLNSITDRVYKTFNSLETGKINELMLNENIVTNKKHEYKDGIILEVPLGIITNNYLIMNLSPKIPVRISLTGEFESEISTKVEEYGINNALITINVDITVTEQITMPFITERIKIENKIPISINLVNGKIPNYYLNGFEKSSNIHQSS